MKGSFDDFFQHFIRRVLKWSGGFYLLLATLAAQAGSLIVSIPTMYLAQINAEFSIANFNRLTSLANFLYFLSGTFLLLLAYLLNKDAFHSLQLHKKGGPAPEAADTQLAAWQQISTWTWRYAIVTSLLHVSIIGIPLLSFLYFRAHASSDQLIYILISVTIGVLTIITLGTSILDRLLIPARTALLPTDFGAQLAGARGLTLSRRMYLVVPAMVLLSILLVAPIGYHQTVTVLYEEIGSIEVLKDLQLQSILVSILAAFLGLALVALFSISLSHPLNEMLEVFNKIEQGDLKQRARVLASDEIGQVAIYFNRMISRLDELQATLEKQVQERTAQLEVLSEMGRVATSTLEPQKLMENIVQLIEGQLGHYHTAIYLVDASNHWAEIKEASGEAGRVLKDSQYRVEINDLTMLGRAIKRRETQVVLTSSKEGHTLRNPLLPFTRSEIIVPLLIGDKALGALDIHSTKEAAFGQQEIDTLQNLANQAAIALENARLFQETQQNLQELRTLQRQYLQQAWQETNLPRRETTVTIGEDANLNKEQTIEIPLVLRDQPIGKISLEREESLTPEENTWLQAIATQAALALENARLLEETQNLANREKTITDISGKIWTSSTIEGILQTTIRELGAALDAAEATIELSDIE